MTTHTVASQLLLESPAILLLIAIALALYLRMRLNGQAVKQRRQTRRTNKLESDVAGLRQSNDNLAGEAENWRTQAASLAQQVDRLEAENRDLRYTRYKLTQELDAANAQFAAGDAAYEQRLLARQLERWFVLLKGQRCRSRAQIGAYVLYPLLRFLGYRYDEFDVDHPVPARGAGKPQSVLVSCYVFDMLSGSEARPLFVLQSVDPDLGITDAQRGATDMNAYMAGATKYALTDGEHFELYHVGPHKIPVLHFRLDEMATYWNRLYAELSPAAFS